MNDLFKLSKYDKGSEIKAVSSVVKWGLKDLFALENVETSLFCYWQDFHKENIFEESYEERNKAFESYSSFCSGVIENYFNAIKSVYNEGWEDKDSKIFSVASINGFLIALKKSLQKYGIKDVEFYKTCFRKLDISFSREDFNYSASKGWGDFSRLILKECFEID